MRKILFIVLGTIIGVMSIEAQIVVSINGTTTGAATVDTRFFPITTSSSYSYSQQIYTKAEIAAANGGILPAGQTIAQIAFSYFYATPQTKNSQYIFLGNTTKDNFANALVTDLVAFSDLELVYSGTIAYTNANANWVTIALNQSFQWDTTKNIVVCVINNDGTSSTGTNATFRAHNLALIPVYRTMYTNAGTAYSTTANPTSITRVYQRNDIKFTFQGNATSCANVTSAGISTVGNNTATVLWTPQGGESHWQVQYKQSAISSWDDSAVQMDTATSMPHTLQNLAPSTNYDVRVSAICNLGGTTQGQDVGAWSSSANFTTACGTIAVFPWNEGFEADWVVVPPSIDVAPACWIHLNGRGGYPTNNLKWNRSTDAAHSGVASAAMFGGYTTVQHSDWLITPRLTLTGGELLSYWTKHNNAGYVDDISLYIYDVTAQGSDITSVDDTTYFTPLVPTELQTTSWTKRTVSLNHAGDFRIAFVRNHARGGAYLYLDDVKIIAPPPCPEVSDFTVVAQSSSAIQLSWWKYDNQGQGFDIIYGNANVFNTQDPNTYTLIHVADTVQLPYTITGLNLSIPLSVAVRHACGDLWNIATVRTPANLPYNADFSDPDIAMGWTLLNDNQSNKWHIGEGIDGGGYAVPAGSPNNYSLYVSNDNGITNNYDAATSRIYAYRDFYVPPATTELKLSFDWKAKGYSIANDFARFYWLLPSESTSFVAGNIPATSVETSKQIGNYTGGYGENQFTNVLTWQHEEMSICPQQYSNLGGRTWRLYIHWRNNQPVALQPPAAIANLKLEVVTCRTPQLFVNLTTVAADSVRLSWATLAQGTTLMLQYMPAASTDWTTATTHTGIATNSYLLTGLSPATLYKIRIKSVCGAANESMWSNVVIIMTSSLACSAPTQLRLMAVTHNSVTLSWKRGGIETEWSLAYRETGTANWQYISSNSIDTFYTISGLNDTTSYDVAVRAICGISAESNWTSGTCITRQACTVPANITSDPASPTSMQIQWSSGSAATEWIVEYKSASASNWTTLSGNPTSPACLLSGLTPDTAYIVRIRSICGSLDTSNYSPNHLFTANHQAICRPPIALTATTITDQSVAITWSAGNAETVWIVSHANSNNPTQKTETPTQTPSLTINNLTANTAYNICVKAVCTPNLQSVDTCISVTTTNIETLKFTNRVTLYPNPVTDQLIILMDMNFYALEITNLLGQQLYATALTGTQTKLDVSGYRSGVYFVKLYSDYGIITRKFVKK